MAQAKTSTTVQAGKFGLVGILNTLIDYVIYEGLTVVFHIPTPDAWRAKVVSGAIAMLNSFYFNRRWVFHGSKQHAAQQATRFFVSTLIGVFVIQLGLVYVFTSQYPQVGAFFFDLANSFGIISLAPHILTKGLAIKTVAFGIATVGSLTWNFILYKFWAFKE